MKSSLTLFLGLGLTLTTTLHAQDGQPKREYTNFQDTTFQLSEISVTAKRPMQVEVMKLGVPAAYLPVTTNTLPSRLLANHGITNIQDAARFLPGVRVQTSYGAFQQISIRGFDHSIIMVDGVRDERSSINNSYPFMDLTSVERIELLKGPASVLYGQSAVGGVLNIVRKAPTAQQHVNARVAYGSYQNLQTTLGFGGRLFGPLNYSANFNYQTQDGWRDNAMRRLSGYLALGGKLTEADELDIRIGALRDFYPTEIGLPDVMPADIYRTADDTKAYDRGDMLPGLDKKARYNSESDFMYNRNFNASVMWRHTFGEAARLTDKLSYTYDDIDYFGTEDLAYLTSDKPIYKHYYKSGNRKVYINLDSLRYDFPLRFEHIARTWNNQLELNGRFATGSVKHNYLGGYSLIALYRNSFSGYDLGKDVYGPGLTGIGSVYNPHSIGWMETRFSKAFVSRIYMHGFYLQDLLELNEKLKMLLAGRYDLYSYKRVSGVPTIDGRAEFDMPADSLFTRTATGAFSFRAGLVYIPTQPLSLFASVGSYFKPDNTTYSEDTRYFDRNGQEFFPNKDSRKIFDPERGIQVEAGARYELSEMLSADFSLFYINRENERRYMADKGDVINGETLDKDVVGQVGRMDSRGFDVELTYRPVRGLSLTAGYGYTDARLRKIATNPYLDGENLVGKRYAYSPRHSFYVYADYTIREGVLRGLGFNFDITYQDEVYRNFSNTSTFPSYWMTDASISYRLPNRVRLRLNVNNVFNTDYYNQALGSQYVPGMPRNFLISAAYSL